MTMGKKILLGTGAVIAVIIIIVLVVLWQNGAFNDPELSLEKRGPYHYVYIQRTGSFSQISAAFSSVDSLFAAQGITKEEAVGMYLDNPENIELDNMRWRVGYLVSDSIQVEEPLRFVTIAAQMFIVAGIQAHPMIAPIKTYPALNEWVKQNQYQITGAALEIYYEDGLIESMFPVQKQ